MRTCGKSALRELEGADMVNDVEAGVCPSCRFSIFVL